MSGQARIHHAQEAHTMASTNTPPALPVHPTTGLSALGFTSRGPVRPQMDGDENGSGGDGQGGGQARPDGPDGQLWDPARPGAHRQPPRGEPAPQGQAGPGPGVRPAAAPTAGQQDGQAPATDDGTADQLRAAMTELAIYRGAGKYGAALNS